jgi:cytochrome bd ubiquinol oxidase subunit II
MEAVWYSIIVMMLSTYVVLDGFDFGAGMLHLFVAKTDSERRQILSAIGPFWNGNEVWLIASGGLLVFAFPKVYASGFSGFYLPLMMVLWLLILRGISIEFRSKEANPLWQTFWDMTFSLSSLMMAVVLGAALGNVIRGLPLRADGYFEGALFTDFMPGPNPGVLDWYTVSVGLMAALVLAGHGLLFLVWKTSGAVQERCRLSSKTVWLTVVAASVIVTLLTAQLRPQLYQSLIARPWTWILAAGVVTGISGVFWSIAKRRELLAFASSAIFILSLLTATAAGMYPNMLISTVDPNFNVTALNAANTSYGLSVGLVWWIPTVGLAILYFANLYHTFRAKTEPSADLYGD